MGLLEVLDDLFGIQIKIKRRKKAATKPASKKTKKVKKTTKKKTSKRPKKKIKKTVKKKPKTKAKKKTVKRPKKKTVRKKKPLKVKRRPLKKPSPGKITAKVPSGKEIGIITHYFGKISVGIIKLKSELRVGEKIHIKGAHDDFIQTIKSMQLNHKEVTLAKRGDEIGIKVGQKVHENDKVYKIG